MGAKTKTKSKAKQSNRGRSATKPKSQAKQDSAKACDTSANADAKTRDHELSPQERKFIQLLLDVSDRRTIAQKGVEAGYSENYGYDLHAKPKIKAAIKKELEREEELLLIHRVRIKKALAERAEQERVVTDKDGRSFGVDAGDANKAAELFLKTTGDIGSGGHNTHVNVTQNAGEGGEKSFEERLQDQLDKRDAALTKNSK
jgi:hypothetical protein